MPKKLISGLILLTFFPSVAMGLPAGGKVAGGAANINQPKGQTLNINQLTERAIINWKGFSIDVNELVKFTQPSSKSVVLNRVTGIDPSSILGRLAANGRVFIVNPNGILFGPNSMVDVAGLLATTLNINDNDFLAGKYNFSQDPNKALSYVINKGEIKIADNGFVFLVAPGVVNEGLIIANLGKAVMASGQKLAVDFTGDGLITFAIEGKVLDRVLGPDGSPLTSAVNNDGTIRADGGQVVLTARASSEIFSSVVNNSGVIEARSLVNHGGVIRLEGSDPVANTGELGWQNNLDKVHNAEGAVINTGRLDVSAAERGAAPGQITLSGQMVGSSGTIAARGAEGSQGGGVLISSTDKTVLTSDSQIDTSGVSNSSAGNVVVWSDKETVFRGTIVATGGETGGNGGQIEVSGHENLSFTGQVNALAPNGSIGSLLLDPMNITVATGGTATLPQVDQFSDTPATSQTIAPATINAAAANVALQANNDIGVTDAIAMTTAGRTLTMRAGRNINIDGNVSTTNGAITLTANDSGAVAANRSAGTGNINMAVGTTLNAGTAGVTATVGSSTTAPFSPGNITLQNVIGGNAQITSPNTVSLNGAINAGSGAITLAAETININNTLTSTGALTLNPVTAAGNLTVSSSSASNLSDGFSSITIGNAAGTGAVTVNALTVSDPLTIRSPTTTGTVTVNGPITGLGNASMTLTGGTGTTPITLNAGIATTGNAITLNDNVGLGANVMLDSTNSGGSPAGAPISVTGTINGAQALTLNGGTTGNVTLSGAIGITQPLQSLAVTNANALTVPAVTTTGDIQLNAQNAVTLNGAVNAGSGAVTINANSDGAGAQSFTMNAGSSIATTGDIDVNVNAPGGGTGTAALRDISTGGTLTVRTNTGGNTTGGAISQAAGSTLNVGTAKLSTGNGTITLNNASNDFGTVAVSRATNVTLRDVNALDLGVSTISGTLSVTAAGSITDSGNLNVTGTTTLAAGAGNDITLDSAGNNFSTVAITSGRNVTLIDADALNVAASTVSGTLNLTAAGAITDSANLNVAGTTTLAAGTGNDITLNNTNNFSTVSITSGRNVTLNDANALDLGASTISGTLSVTAAGAITDSGNLNVAGTTTLAAGAGNDITLDSAGNDFSTVSISSGRNVTLLDNNALNLGASTVSGTLNATTAGALTDSGNVVVTGTTTLAVGAGNDITLNNANNFSSVSITSGRNVTLNDTNALILGASTVSGTLGVTTAGALTQSGPLNVTGTTTLAVGSGNDITLNNASNNFSTVGITSGRNVTLANSTALDLGTSTIAGALGVSAAGAITDSGNLNVTGTTTLAGGAGNDIGLDSAGNNFSTVAITSGRNVTLIDSNALNLGASTVSGTLDVTTAGAITDSGNLSVTGTTTLAAGTGNDITLNSAGNNFSTLGIVSGRNVTLVDRNALDLGTSSVSGNLALTTGGDVTQSGALSVAGTTLFMASAGNTDILLSTQANNFGGVVSFAGSQSNFRDIALRNTNAGATAPTLSGLTSLRNLRLEYDNVGVNLPALTANGTLNVTAGGAITQSGNVNVAGITTLAAGTHDVDLNNVGNNFSSVLITSANNVNLRDADTLDLGSSSVSGTLDITTNGAMTQSGPVAVAGTATLAAGAGDITFDNAANDFSTVGIISANNVTLRDSNNISLGSSTAAGNFSVTAGGAIRDGDGSAINITATTANLIAASNIGTSSDPVETNVGTLNATTTGGGIFINEANAVTLGNVSASGGNDIVISNASGDMTVNSVTTTGGAVTLASFGGAIQDANGTATNVTAGTLIVSAANGVDLDTTITSLSSVIVTGAGSIDINNTGALAVNNATTANGNIALNATGGNLAINIVNAGGIGTVALSTTTSGDVTLGTVATPNNVTITSAKSITDTNGVVNNITASTSTLTAAANIGTPGDPIETTVGALNGSATAGGIYINETDAVTLNNILAGGGNVAISNTTGDMIIHSITATAGGIDLTASAGSILDGNGSANNLSAVAVSNLRAFGGVIGLSTDPIEVNINPGLLGVAATGQIGGVSVHINGTVSPTNTLTLLNSPPGEVIFNSSVLNRSPINLPNLTGIASELNFQRVNEVDYITELLIDVISDNFFRVQSFHCEMDDSLRDKLDSDLCDNDVL